MIVFLVRLLKELPNPEGGKLKRHSTVAALPTTQHADRGRSNTTASQLKSSSASSACLSHMDMATAGASVGKEAFKPSSAPPADKTDTVLPPPPPALPQPVIKTHGLDSLLENYDNVVSVEDDGVEDDDEGR